MNYAPRVLVSLSLLVLARDPSRWTKILITGNSFGLGRVVKYASLGRRHGSTAGNIRATRKLLIYHPGYTSPIVYFFAFSLYPGNNYTLLIVIERLRSPRGPRVIRSVRRWFEARDYLYI